MIFNKTYKGHCLSLKQKKKSKTGSNREAIYKKWLMKREISTLAEEIYSRGTALGFHKTTKARFYLKSNFEPNTLAFEDIRLYIFCNLFNQK